jgi:hypothetical protein
LIANLGAGPEALGSEPIKIRLVDRHRARDRELRNTARDQIPRGQPTGSCVRTNDFGVQFGEDDPLGLVRLRQRVPDLALDRTDIVRRHMREPRPAAGRHGHHAGPHHAQHVRPFPLNRVAINEPATRMRVPKLDRVCLSFGRAVMRGRAAGSSPGAMIAG